VGINQARDSVKPARLQNIPPMQKIILTSLRHEPFTNASLRPKLTEM
jgi:hypothetical protein